MLICKILNYKCNKHFRDNCNNIKLISTYRIISRCNLCSNSGLYTVHNA